MGSLEPPSGTKLFRFHGEIYEKLYHRDSRQEFAKVGGILLDASN